MGGADIGNAAVAGEGREHADAELLEVGRVLPHVAGDVVLADQVDIERCRLFRFFRSDQVHQRRFAAEPAAEVLAADEAGGVDRHHRHAVLLRGVLADGVDVVADQGGDAGRIDEDRLRRVVVP